MHIYVIVALIGFLLLFRTVTNPSRLWPIIIFAALIVPGVVYQQISFFDEYLVFCVIAGAVAAIVMSGVDRCRRDESRIESLHRLIFFLLICYMICQAMRGMLMTDMRKIRWVLYFITLGTMSYMLTRKSLLPPSWSRLARLSLVVLIVYFSMYIFYLIFSRQLTGVDWYEGQNLYWGGSAYAIFPIVIALPIALILANDEDIFYRQLSWFGVLLFMLTAFILDSRAGWFVILGCFGVTFIRMDFKRAAIVAILFLSIMLFYINFIWPEYQNFDEFWATDIVESSKLLWKQDVDELRPGDIGRFVHFHMAPKILMSDPKILVLGAGYRASEDLIAPHLTNLFLELDKAGMAEANLGYGSTIGITSLAVETGLVGMALFIACFILTGLQIQKVEDRQCRLLLQLSLCYAFVWLVITNPTDQVLFYFLIMPQGLLIQLGKSNFIKTKELHHEYSVNS